MTFTDLADGLRLPGRDVLIPWNGRYEELKENASEARDWLPYGHKVRYGQLHWEDEILTPSKPSTGAKGKVIAYVKGDPLTVRQFEIHLWDDAYLKKGIFRYSLWKDTLTSILGVPDIDPNECTNKNILAPTLKWKIGEVTVSSFYVLGKGDEYDGVRITHEKHKL